MSDTSSFEEKVDYIYKELKSQKKARYLNFLFKFFIIIILIYWVMNINKWLQNKTISNKISTTIWTIIKPIVSDLIKNMDLNTIYQENKNKNTIIKPKAINNNKKW